MSEIVVPDKIGVEIGWRSWQVRPAASSKGELRLFSLNSTVWKPRVEMVARCRGRCEIPAAAGCSCGIYAARDLDHLRSMGYHTQGATGLYILGVVALWGQITPGTQGFRAQYAYPKRLYCPFTKLREWAVLRKIYGVPLIPFNPFAPAEIERMKGVIV